MRSVDQPEQIQKLRDRGARVRTTGNQRAHAKQASTIRWKSQRKTEQAEKEGQAGQAEVTFISSIFPRCQGRSRRLGFAVLHYLTEHTLEIYTAFRCDSGFGSGYRIW